MTLDNHLRVISCGWGAQSWTLAVMAALGVIPGIDAVIHSDTTFEASHTYAFATEWTPWLEEHDVNVVTVRPDPQKLENFAGNKMVYIPAFTRNEQGKRGQLRRQCTGDWKIAPIRRWLQAHRGKRPVTMMLGISAEEWTRAKDSQVKYITHEYPLLDMNMTRADCVAWLAERGLPAPHKSACVFCPYHAQSEWRSVRQCAADWQRAVEIDETIRRRRPPFDLYVHQARVPLADVDLSTPEERGQLSLLECDSGYCWL
jgi:hypothetical protein